MIFINNPKYWNKWESYLQVVLFLFIMNLGSDMMINEKRLKELMNELGYKNKKELSYDLKIPYSTLCYMTSGHDSSISSIYELASFFDVTIDYLIDKPKKLITISEEGIFKRSSNDIFDSVSVNEIVIKL